MQGGGKEPKHRPRAAWQVMLVIWPCAKQVLAIWYWRAHMRCAQASSMHPAICAHIAMAWNSAGQHVCTAVPKHVTQAWLELIAPFWQLASIGPQPQRRFTAAIPH